MAKSLIARFTFHPWLRRFTTTYCNMFPDCKTALELKNEVDSLSVTDDSTDLLDLFLDSFSHCHKELKERKAEIIADPKCQFMHYLELSHVWGKASKEQRDAVWKGLIGGWLIVEIVIRIPPAVMIGLESEVRMHMKATDGKVPTFDKDRFKRSAGAILEGMSDGDVVKLTQFFWEFIISPDSPIKDVIPVEFHHWIDSGLDLVKTPEGQEMLLGHVNPAIRHLTAGIDEEALETGDGTADAPDVPETVERKRSPGPTAEQIAKARTERSRLLGRIVDMFANSIGDNAESIRMMLHSSTSPSETLAKMFGALVRNFATPGFLGSFARKRTPEEVKEEEDAEMLSLFGSSFLSTERKG